MQKEGRIKEELIILICIVLLFIILISFNVSAGWLDWIKTITGKATSGKANVTVSIAGPAIVQIIVWNQSLAGGFLTSEGIAATLIFNVTVSDADGMNDINDSSVKAVVNGTAGTIVINTTACSPNSGQTTTTAKNYTCNLQMWYWYENGTWTINVTANDKGNKTYNNSVNMTFYVIPTTSIMQAPTIITFPTGAPGEQSKTSNQNTTLNNTGNVIINSPNIFVNAINLQGLTETAYYLNASNFTASWNNSVGPPVAQCTNTTGASAVFLVNATDIGVTGANLTRGNNSLANGYTGQEILYYCIPQIPVLPSQSYVSNSSGSWTVSVTG